MFSTTQSSQVIREAFPSVCKAVSLSVRMAEDMIEVDDAEIHDLTLHIGHTGKL